MTHARSSGARLGQAVVQPGRRAVAEISADRLMDRRQHLEQHEHDPRERERPAEVSAALDGGDEHAHGNRKHGGQGATQQEHQPPGRGQQWISLRQNAEELPLLPLAPVRHVHER